MPSWAVVLLAQLLPIVLGELGKLIQRMWSEAKPLVEQAAKDGTLPDGAARHEWVKSRLEPEAKATASNLLETLKVSAVDVGIKFAYDSLQKKLKK
jgi:hypothetical protein